MFHRPEKCCSDSIEMADKILLILRVHHQERNVKVFDSHSSIRSLLLDTLQKVHLQLELTDLRIL
jgi:hypothetical protein